jgi:hypothetical protein
VGFHRSFSAFNTAASRDGNEPLYKKREAGTLVLTFLKNKEKKKKGKRRPSIGKAGVGVMFFSRETLLHLPQVSVAFYSRSLRPRAFPL